MAGERGLDDLAAARVGGLDQSAVFKLDLVGVDLCDGVLGADGERHGRGGHDQHHRGENADRRQAGGVLLHAVDHAGDGDEVVWLVVVAAACAQHFEHRDAAGDEQQIGADDDEGDGQKEQRERLKHVLRGDGDPVAAAQAEDADQRHQPARLGLALALRGALEQIDRARPRHAPQLDKIGQRIDDGKHDRRGLRRGRHEFHSEFRLSANQLDRHQRDQLGQTQPERDAGRHRHERDEQRFIQHHARDMAALHAEDVVQAELVPAALGQEAVGVEQEDRGKDRDDERADNRVGLERRRALDAVERVAHRNRADDVEHGDGERAGQQVGKVELPVAPDVGQREAQIEELTHCAHHPSRSSSACRRSAGTCRPRSARRGRAGGRPARP